MNNNLFVELQQQLFNEFCHDLEEDFGFPTSASKHAADLNLQTAIELTSSPQCFSTVAFNSGEPSIKSFSNSLFLDQATSSSLTESVEKEPAQIISDFLKTCESNDSEECLPPTLEPVSPNLFAELFSHSPMPSSAGKMKKPRKIERRAPIWKYFTKGEPGVRSTATCSFCGKVIKITNGTTSGMIRHINNVHNEERKEFTLQEEAQKNEILSKLFEIDSETDIDNSARAFTSSPSPSSSSN